MTRTPRFAAFPGGTRGAALSAAVVLTVGVVLVRVTYGSADEREPLGGRDALRGAYAAAKEVVEALPGG